jgi:hypothetical protein
MTSFFFTPFGGGAVVARTLRFWCSGLGLALLPTGTALAQAPAWELAMSGNNQTSTTNFSVATAAAVDARGNVFVTGYFAGTVSFGSTQLTSAGGDDLFVAKWDATAQGFTWATRGGGTGLDEGRGIAVNGTNVYVTGAFNSNANASIAGQGLAGAGGLDVFVAKYVDTSTGSTPATSSFVNAWATSGGGTGNDTGLDIAVSGPGVFVTGLFVSNTSASFAGQALAGAGLQDVFVAKYVDTSTGSTPATSSFANAWATSAGGTGNDRGWGLAVSGSRLYVVGNVIPPATFGSISFGSSGSDGYFLAALPAATPTATAAAVAQVLTLSPNPAHGAARLTGVAPRAAVAVLDALGRPVTKATADAAGTARLALPAGLAPGVYLVRSGAQVRRLVVE